MASLFTDERLPDTENDDSEYEYEYDQTATEAFFIDIDFSSVKDGRNGHNNHSTSQRTIPNPFTAQDVRKSHGDSTGDGARDEAIVSPSARAIEENKQSHDVQIMELESHNPVVLYNNRIYSCTWHDMIGTNMFFTQHSDDVESEPVVSDGHVALVGTSRIKLVAREAQLLPKHAPSESKIGTGEASVQAARGSGLGALSTTNPKINADIKKQAKFLQKLMEVKSAKGEMDNVHTVCKRGFRNLDDDERNAKKRKGPMPTSSRPELEKEIRDLNQLTLRGDPDALERLEEIYGLLGDNEPSGATVPQSIAEEDSEDQTIQTRNASSP